jgi:hypothetical protein
VTTYCVCSGPGAGSWGHNGEGGKKTDIVSTLMELIVTVEKDVSQIIEKWNKEMTPLCSAHSEEA